MHVPEMFSDHGMFMFLDALMGMTACKCNRYKCWYHITPLFTNVPLDETIHILADKAFKDNWFNTTYNMRLWYATSPTPLICWYVLMKPTPPFNLRW